MKNDSHAGRYGVISALVAACFFGLGAPVSKILLRSIHPTAFAGLLYLGSWAGLTVYSIFRKKSDGEGGLKRGDLPYIAGSVACGGAAAPLLLLYGLLEAPGSVTALLLNTEGVLTALLAAFVFREHVPERVWAAALAMLIAGSVLTYLPGGLGWGLQPGSLLVLASALMWAVDNNLTRCLSHRDPVMLARYKGLASGVVNISIAVLIGAALPSGYHALGAAVFGAVGYGASLVFFIYALRHLGASRTTVYFGAAPFIGVIASVILLGEALTSRIAAAALLMLMGLWLMLRERHDHEHTHGPLTHEHSHVHDCHHDHAHGPDGSADGQPHCHSHEHGQLTHSHAHAPDLHHNHKH